jgi:hypothetical protein
MFGRRPTLHYMWKQIDHGNDGAVALGSADRERERVRRGVALRAGNLHFDLSRYMGAA